MPAESKIVYQNGIPYKVTLEIDKILDDYSEFRAIDAFVEQTKNDSKIFDYIGETYVNESAGSAIKKVIDFVIGKLKALGKLIKNALKKVGSIFKNIKKALSGSKQEPSSNPEPTKEPDKNNNEPKSKPNTEPPKPSHEPKPTYTNPPIKKQEPSTKPSATPSSPAPSTKEPDKYGPKITKPATPPKDYVKRIYDTVTIDVLKFDLIKQDMLKINMDFADFANKVIFEGVDKANDSIYDSTLTIPYEYYFKKIKYGELDSYLNSVDIDKISSDMDKAINKTIKKLEQVADLSKNNDYSNMSLEINAIKNAINKLNAQYSGFTKCVEQTCRNIEYARKMVNQNMAKFESAMLLEAKDAINYENPMGRKITSYRNGGTNLEIISGDAVDVELKNTLETFDVKKHKLLLESSNIVDDYNNFIACNFKKNVARDNSAGTPSYSNYFKYFNREFLDSGGEHLPDVRIKRMLTEEYHITTDPVMIRKIVEARIKYIEGVNAILKEMITKNGAILGLSSQQIEKLITGLSNDDTNAKTVGEIKDIVAANKNKYVNSNGTILDLRPLGLGVFVGSDDDYDHTVINNDDKLKTAIQQCMTFDLVLNAHGGSNYEIDKKKAADDLNRIEKNIKDELDDKLRNTNSLGGGLMEYHKDFNTIAGRIMLWLYKDYATTNDQLTYDNKFKFAIFNLFDNKGSNSFKKYVQGFPRKEQEDIYKRIYLIFRKNLDSLKDFYKKYDIKRYSIMSNGGYNFTFDVAKGGSKKWNFNITYLDGKKYNDLKLVLKMAKSKGFDKIMVNSCNPAGLDLPKDLTKNVKFGKHSIFKEENVYDNLCFDIIDAFNEYQDAFEMLDDIENEYIALAEEYNIDYYDDEFLNESYNYISSGEYIREMEILNEGYSKSQLFEKVITFIGKVIGFFISLVKKFINAVKSIIGKIHSAMVKRKQNKINKSNIKVKFITVKGNVAAITPEKEVDGQQDLEEYHKASIQNMVKAIKANTDKQIKLENNLKKRCEDLKREEDRQHQQ